MNQIELITGLPDWRFKPHCEEELAMSGTELVDATDFIWRVGNVAVAGFIYQNYMCPPWMWFVLAEGVRVKDLVDFRRVASFIPKGTITAVDASFKVGIKFAEIYGFQATGEEVIHLGKPYKIMRKA